MEKPLQNNVAMRASYDKGLALLDLTCESKVVYVSLAWLNLTFKLCSLLHLIKESSASRQRRAEAFGFISLEVHGSGEQGFKSVPKTLLGFGPHQGLVRAGIAGGQKFNSNRPP